MASPRAGVTKRDLYREFSLFNARFFDGRVLPPAIHWCRMRQYGEWVPPCSTYPHGRIFLSTMGMPKCGWRGVLLHEMVHAWLESSHGEPDHEDTKVAHHGPHFAAWCNAIGAELGLPETTIADCWAWPWECHFSEVEPG